MLPLVEKEDISPRKKSKRERYGYLRAKTEKLVPWIYERLGDSSNYHGEINMRARDVAKDIGLENKSDAAIYAGLRFVLFFEGISVCIRNNGEENFLIMRRVDMRDGVSPSIIKTLDNMELDGWQIKRDNDYLTFKHSIRRGAKGIYILESEGNIYFDRRNLTEEQALDFVRYMSSKELRAPDVVYNTPINIILTDEYLNNRYRHDYFDVNKVGKEFRITKSGSEFLVTSIYGKECTIYQFEMDSLVKGCSVYSIMSNFDRALMIEKIPERVGILKKILPEIKTKYMVMIKGHKLVIVNSIGTFHLSLADGTLHKIYDEKGDGNKYICVGPIYGDKENIIIYNGIKYEVDRVTGTILSKMMMLLEEKYPDDSTRRQVFT